MCIVVLSVLLFSLAFPRVQISNLKNLLKKLGTHYKFSCLHCVWDRYLATCLKFSTATYGHLTMSLFAKKKMQGFCLVLNSISEMNNCNEKYNHICKFAILNYM